MNNYDYLSNTDFLRKNNVDDYYIMSAPTLSSATIVPEGGSFGWTDINFNYGVSIKKLNFKNDEQIQCVFDESNNKIIAQANNSSFFSAWYEIDITVPFHFTGLKGSITLRQEAERGSGVYGVDNYYYPTDLTTWNQSYHDIFTNENYGGMFSGSEHQIIANSAGYSSGTELNSPDYHQTSITQTYTQTTGMKPTNIFRMRIYQDINNHWTLSASDFSIQALPDVSFPVVQLSFSSSIASNTNVNTDDFSLKIHGETTSIGKVITDDGNVLLLSSIDKRSPLVTNSPIVDASLVSGNIELTFNNNVQDVSTYNAGDFVVTDSTSTVTIAPSVSSNKLILTPSNHTFSNLTNVRIVYTRHATANRNLLYTDNTAIESFDLLLDNTLSSTNRNKAIEITYTKHATASRNIADASSNAVDSFTQNNDNTAAPTLSSMTIGTEGHRMGGWRKLDYTGGVTITELLDYNSNCECLYNEKLDTISMNQGTGSVLAVHQIDIKVPFKITGLRGQLVVHSDTTNLAGDYYYPEDLTTWAQSIHEISINEQYEAWLVGTDKQIIARVGGTNGSGVLNTKSKGAGYNSIPYDKNVLIKYVQTTGMTSTDVVRIQVYQESINHWTIDDLQLEVLPDINLKIIELNFSGSVYLGSNTQEDIFSVKRGNDSVRVVEAKSVGSKILLLTDGIFTDVEQANVEYYNDKFSSVGTNGNNLELTFSNNLLLLDDIKSNLTLKNSSGIPLNPNCSIVSGKLSLSKGLVDLTSPNSPLKDNFSFSDSTNQTQSGYLPKFAFMTYPDYVVGPRSNNYVAASSNYTGTDPVYNGSESTGGYGGDWVQIDVGINTIAKRVECWFFYNTENPSEFKLFGSTDNSTFSEILFANNIGGLGYKRRYYNLSNTTAYRYYRIVVNKLTLAYSATKLEIYGWVQILGIPESTVSFSNTNYTIEYEQSNVDKLVKSNDIDISIPSFKVVNGVDNTFRLRNLSGNTVDTFTKNNEDSGTPICTSVSIANENSRMGGWRKLDYSGGVTITNLADYNDNTVCTLDNNSNTISMSGGNSSVIGLYQIDIKVPFKITGLRGQLKVHSNNGSSTEYLLDDYYYPEDLTTWVQSIHEISRNAQYGAWVVGTDKQIIARVGGTNGLGVLNTKSRAAGYNSILVRRPVLLKYVQTTGMTSTDVVRIQVYQETYKHWTIDDLQLEVLPDTNLKLVELNFSSSIVLNTELKKDIISLRRGGEKVNIIDIKESSSKALFLTDKEFLNANEIDVQYYQDKVTNVTVDSNNLQITFNNTIISKESLLEEDFIVKNYDGVVIPVKPSISNGKLILSKSGVSSSDLIDLSSPNSQFYKDFKYQTNGNGNQYGALKYFFDLRTDSAFTPGDFAKNTFSDGDYTSDVTTGSYTGPWVEIDIGRIVTVKRINIFISSGNDSPKDYKIFGTNNHSSWNELLGITNRPSEATLYNYSVNPSSGYRYYRIVINKVQSGTSFGAKIRYVQYLGIPEDNNFTHTNYTIRYNKNNRYYENNILRNSNPSIAVPSFKIVGTNDLTPKISNYRGTAVDSFNQNSGDSAAPSYTSTAIVNENSKFGWQSVTLGTPTITFIERIDNETMVWDNTAKTATMSGSTYSSSSITSIIQLDFKAPCYFVGLRGNFSIEALTGNKADDYYYPEDLTTWNQGKSAITRNNNYGANLLGSDKQIIGRVGGTNGSGVLNTMSIGGGYDNIPIKRPVILKYVQTTGMTETNIIRIRIYQESYQHYKLSNFNFEVLPATTYKIIELTLSENAIHKENFDTTDFDFKGLGEIGQISNMKVESGNLYLLPSLRVPILNSLNLRYRANTFSSLAIVSGNLDITFSDDVTVSGSLNSNNFVVKNADGIIMSITPTIYNNKLRITKNPFQYMATSGKVFTGQIYSHSSANYATTESAEQMFDSTISASSYGWRSGHKFGNGTLLGLSGSTEGYAGEWVQVDLGRSILLDNLKVHPYGSRNNEHPAKMRLFSSTNGISWTQVHDWSGLTLSDDWYPNSVWTPLSVTGLSVTARYFRLVINENLGGAYCSLKELELNGYLNSSSFTSTDGTIIYTKSGIASENIVNASDSSQAVGSFTLFNGSEDLTGHLTDLAGNSLPAFNVLSPDSTAPTLSSSSLSGNQFTLVFSESIYDKDTYNTADFDVQISGTSITVSSIAVSSGNVVLALSSTPSSINALRVVYTKHATTSRNIVDNAGNPVASFTHIPSNDSTPPTFSGMSLGGEHNGTGLVSSIITKSESDYAPSYSSIALVSGKIEVTFTSNVANTGGNLVVKEGGSVVSVSGNISGGKLVIAKIGTGSNFSPGGANLINTDGTAHSRDRGDLGNLVDGNTGTSSYMTSSYTNSTHGPFITALDIPSSKVGQAITKVIINKSGSDDYGTASFKVGYRRSSNNYSLNVSSVDMTTSTGTVNTGTPTFSNDTDWHVTGVSGATIITLNLGSNITLATGDKILIRWTTDHASARHFLINEITLTSAQESGSFTSLGNVEVDYTKGSGSGNLRDSNGFDVPSFEITNGTNTTGVVPAYASIATSSNNIEVTFNQTLVDPGSLNKDDFHVTYNGSVYDVKPSISGGKLVLTSNITLSTTSYDISSSSSTLSGQTYTASSELYEIDDAFDGSTSSRWVSQNMTGTTTIDGSSYSGPWLQVDIGQNTAINKFTIYYTANNSQSIKTAKIAASTNGTTWTEIYAITDRDNSSAGTETYNISSGTIMIARYYRIVITAVHNTTVATINEWTLFGVTQAQTGKEVNFTSTSNLAVDYMRHHSTATRRLQNADGDEVASFEITNGSITNDQTKPTFSSVAVTSGKLELTFSENVAVTGTLDATDFSVTDSGTNRPLQNPTISGGKLLLERDEYSLGSATAIDLSSSSSSLSGSRTYSASSQYNGSYTAAEAFDNNITGVSTDCWVSGNNKYSSGTYNGSESTEGYSGEWIQVDVGQNVLLTSYEIYPRPAADAYHSKKMRFFYSTDGTSWTQLQDWDSLSLDDWKPSGSYGSLGPYTTTIVGRYFRLVTNELVGSAAYAQIGEMKLLGVTTSQATALSFTSTDVTIKYIKNPDSSKQLIRVNDPSDAVNSFTVTDGTETTPEVATPKDGILIDFDENIASSSGYSASNFAVTEGSTSKSVRGVKITSDNKVFLSMSTDINSISDTNITYTPSSTASENLETTGGVKTLGFTITNGSDVTTRTNDRLVMNFSEDIVSKTTYSPDDFLILENGTKTSTTTFSSMAVVSGKLELSFNNSVAVTGALNIDDFTIKDTSGNDVLIKTPTISNGKLIIERDGYDSSGTSIDIASNTSTLSGSRTYSASTNTSGTYGSAKAFNNDNTSIYSWISGNRYTDGDYSGSESTDGYDGEWVQVDVGTNVILTSYEIYPRGQGDSDHPKNMRFFSSTDGTNWTQVRDWTGLTTANDWKVGGSYTSVGPYTASAVYGRYFRLVVNELVGIYYSQVQAQIGEIKLLGYAQASEPSMASFSNTDYLITYTKHETASRNIVKAGATTDAIDTFRLSNGSETGLVKKVAQVAVVGGDVQLKSPIILPDNPTSIDISSSTSTLTGTRTYTNSSRYDSDYGASEAFDTNYSSTSSAWVSKNYRYSSGSYNGSVSTEGYAGEWVQVDVGTNVILTSYEIFPRRTGDSEQAEKMRFFSSTDGTSWVQFRDWTGLTLAGDWKVGGSWTSVGPYTTSTYGRYFRLVVNELVGNGTLSQIGEIKLLGYAAISDSFGSDIGNFEIQYTSPGVQARNLIDLAGNVVETFTGRSRPSFKSATLTTTRRVEVTFTVDLKDMTPLKSDFVVNLNGTSTSIESVSISGGKLILNLSKTMTPHSDSDPQVLTLNYTKNSSTTYNIRDAGDSSVESFTGKSITNPTSDTEPPVFTGAEIFDDEPTKIVLNFDFAVTISSPNVSTFSVKVNGSVVTISSVAISGGDVVLTLENAVSNTDTITVSYTKDDSDATKNIKDTNNNVLETPLNSEHASIVVKVASGKYVLEGVSQKTISLVKGFTYTFDISDSSVSGHPIKFSTTSDGSHASGTEYTTGVTSGDTSITFAVPSDAPSTLYYYCGNHSGMGGTINIQSDSFTSVVNSVVATATKSFKNDLQSGGIRDGITAQRWSRFRADKSVLTKSQRKYYGKDYFRTNPSATIFKIVDEYNGQSIAFLKPSKSGDPGTAQAIDLDSDEAEIAFDNTSAEQSSLVSFSFDPLRNDSTTNTVTVKFLFVKRITGTTAKFTYTLDGYSGAGDYENKVVLTPAFSGGGTTGLITVSDMTSDAEQTLTCDVTIEYSPSVGSTLEYTKSFTFFGRNPAGGYSNDNSSTAGDPYIKTIRGVFYKLRDIPHKSVILYDNSNSDRRIQVHGYLEPNVNYKKQVEEFDDSLVSQLGERPINPSFFSKLWVRNKNQEYLIDLETWTELKTGKNIIDLFKVDFAIETCKFNVYLSEKCVTVKLPIDGNFYIIIKRFMNPEIRTGVELSIPTWQSSPTAFGALIYPGETHDIFIDKLDDKTLKRKARKLENMTTVQENFANPETGTVRVVNWKY